MFTLLWVYCDFINILTYTFKKRGFVKLLLAKHCLCDSHIAILCQFSGLLDVQMTSAL